MKTFTTLTFVALSGIFLVSDINFEAITAGGSVLTGAPAAEARVGRPRTARSFAGRHRRIDRRVDRRVGRRAVVRRGYWRNGVWIAAGVAAGAAVATGSCPYYWDRWQASGSRYWRDRYYANCR